MSTLGDDILIWIKLKGFASIEALADQLLVSDLEVAHIFETLILDGQAKAVPLGIKLRAKGSEAAEAAWAKERAFADAEVLDSVARRFTALDEQISEKLSDWKMKKTPTGPVRNTHSDAGYDEALLTDILSLSADARTVLVDLSLEVPRCKTYVDRLLYAEDQVGNGHIRFVASSMVDSVETIWWEIRQDISVLTEPSRLIST